VGNEARSLAEMEELLLGGGAKKGRPLTGSVCSIYHVRGSAPRGGVRGGGECGPVAKPLDVV